MGQGLNKGTQRGETSIFYVDCRDPWEEVDVPKTNQTWGWYRKWLHTTVTVNKTQTSSHRN